MPVVSRHPDVPHPASAPFHSRGRWFPSPQSNLLYKFLASPQYAEAMDLEEEA